MWTPLPEEEEYYNTPAPNDQQSILGQLWTQVAGFGSDPTLGRQALPRSPVELALYRDHKWREGRVQLGKQDGREWVNYQVWEPKEGAKSKGKLA